MICYYFIHKSDLADLSVLKKIEFSRQILIYLSGNLQREQTKFPVFFLCFGKISKFPVFFPDREFFGPFSLFSLCSGYPDYKKNLGRNQSGMRTSLDAFSLQ